MTKQPPPFVLGWLFFCPFNRQGRLMVSRGKTGYFFDGRAFSCKPCLENTPVVFVKAYAKPVCACLNDGAILYFHPRAVTRDNGHQFLFRQRGTLQKKAHGLHDAPVRKNNDEVFRRALQPPEGVFGACNHRRERLRAGAVNVIGVLPVILRLDERGALARVFSGIGGAGEGRKFLQRPCFASC